MVFGSAIPPLWRKDKVSRAWYGPKVLFVSILLGVLIARNQSNRVCLDSNLPWQICVKLNSTGLPAEIVFLSFIGGTSWKDTEQATSLKFICAFVYFKHEENVFIQTEKRILVYLKDFMTIFVTLCYKLTWKVNVRFDYDDRSRSSRWNFASRGECFWGGLHQNVSGEH